MSVWVFAPDGVSIVREYRQYPAGDVIVTGSGRVVVTPANGPTVGIWPVTESPQPSPDYVRSITNTGPGSFIETWTFDQARADARAQAEADELERTAIRTYATAVRAVAQDVDTATAAERGEALEALCRALILQYRV